MTTVHKLRHPIATFVVTVLAVIGIGVGVVAATTTEPVYGPPGARFTVTFPGRVNEQNMKLPAPDNGVGYNAADHRNSPLSITEIPQAT